MEAPKVQMNKVTRSAIASAGGHVPEVKVNSLPNLPVAKPVSIPNMGKKANDTLGKLVDSTDPEFQEFIKEANFISRGFNAVRDRWPQSVKPNRTISVVGGALGAGLGYSEAKQEGQGMFGRIGTAAAGGLVGRFGVGHPIGKELRYYNAAKAGIKTTEDLAHAQTTKDFYNKYQGAKKTEYLANQELAKHTDIHNLKGNNVLERGMDFANKGLNYVSQKARSLARPNENSLQRLTALHGTEGFKASEETFNKNRDTFMNSGNHFVNNVNALKHKGVDIEKLSQHVSLYHDHSVNDLLKNPNGLNHPAIRKAVKNQNINPD